MKYHRSPDCCSGPDASLDITWGTVSPTGLGFELGKSNMEQIFTFRLYVSRKATLLIAAVET